MKPFTYLIGWSHHNIWYYGVRYGKNCDPSDLWVSYFTSSKYVQEFRSKNGDPDIIQIRKVFNDPKLAIKREDRVIRRLRLFENKNFLNKAYSGSIYYDEEVRKKISTAAKGRKAPHLKNKSKEHIDKMRKTKTGVTQTEEHRLAVSRALRKKWSNQPHHCKERILLEEHKKNISNGIKNSEKYKAAKEKNLFGRSGKDNAMFGKKHSEETKQKMRLKALQRKQKAIENMRNGTESK